MPHILIADDEEGIRNVIAEYGHAMGWQVSQAADGQEALEKTKTLSPDIVVLDVMMPRMDGFSALRAIREFSRVPVVMLSALGEEYNKLAGFELGADDYVEKPFSPRLLFVRANAIIARSREAPVQSLLAFDGLTVDTGGRVVLVDGKRAEMTPKEMELFFYLVKNAPNAVSREQIMRDVWGYDVSENEDFRTVDSHIKMLRHSLGPYRDFVITVRAMGYKFEHEPTA